LAPSQLAFKGNAGDYWGKWKTVISAAGLPDGAQALYRAVGVIRSFPEPNTSRAFFEWLNTRPHESIADHLAQVVRHLAHPNGVFSWWLTPPDVPCVPIEVQKTVGLVPRPLAIRDCYVDDFPELAEEIRCADPAPPFFLAIHTVPECVTPIADQLIRQGIPSLLLSAKGPIAVSYAKEGTCPAELQHLLAQLRSERSARELKKRLQALDVPLSLLESRWQQRLTRICTVRIADGLRARYRLRRRHFWPRVQWVLSEAGEVWLDSATDVRAAFFNALADVIFTPQRPRYIAAVLQAALDVNVREYRREVDERAREWEETEGDGDEDPGESKKPHPGRQNPDAAPSKPDPGPLQRSGAVASRATPKKTGSGRQRVVDEDFQRRELKAKHYAWHCQIDLAVAEPTTLAPAGSYVEHQENRQKIIEAHHLDRVTAGGARHAGNLLIISHLNHERVGRVLSRAQVTEALLRECAPREILGADGELWVKGVVAEVVIPMSGEGVPIFFTHEHRKYWLEMSGHDLAVADAETTLPTPPLKARSWSSEGRPGESISEEPRSV
jgi:hypothetical protein